MKRSNKLLSSIFIITLCLLTFLLTITTFAQETYTIKYALHHAVDSVTDLIAHKLADLAYEKSNGKIKIEIYPGAQLGQEREVGEGILYGTHQMASVSQSCYEGTVPGFGLDILPFLVDSYEQLDTLLNNSEFSDEYNRRLLEKGIRILGSFHMGAQQFMFTDKEIKTLDKLKGLKMRAPEMSIYIDTLRVVGCMPTPITFGETYLALQTKIVEGLTISFSNAISMKHYEVAKYMLISNHMFPTLMIVINEDLFQTYPEDIQAVIIESGREATEYGNALAVKIEGEGPDFLEEKGVVINYMSEEDRARFAKLCEPVREKWATERKAADLLEMIEKFKESY